MDDYQLPPEGLRVTSHRHVESFKSIFFDPICIEVEGNVRTNLQLSVLNIQNGDFDLDGLYTVLQSMSAAFVLSAREYENLMQNPQNFMLIADEVRSRFREPDARSGEGGELLLYCMLEAHVGATKILSKMSLKTDSQHHVNGSDGVHLLRIEPNSFQLVFGESKMYANLDIAIDRAFNSISAIKDENFYSDKLLANSQVLNEQADPDTARCQIVVNRGGSVGGGGF